MRSSFQKSYFKAVSSYQARLISFCKIKKSSKAVVIIKSSRMELIKNLLILQFISLLFLQTSALTSPMEVSYNNKYIYTSTLTIPTSRTYKNPLISPTLQIFSIPFPATLSNLSTSSVLLSISNIQLDIPQGKAYMVRGIQRSSTSFLMTLISTNFYEFKTLQMRYLLLSGKFSPINNNNLQFLSFNVEDVTLNSTKYSSFSVNLRASLNRTGGMNQFCTIAGFILLSQASPKILDIDLKIFSVSSTQATFHLYSHSETNTTVSLIQISALIFNSGYYNQENVANFQGAFLKGSEINATSYLQYSNPGNVLNFTTMIGVTGFHAKGSIDFDTTFQDPNSFRVSSQSNFNYISLYYLLLATYYCGYETPYYNSAQELCYDNCPNRTYPNATSLTCNLCSFQCLTCSGQEGCLSCSQSDNRILVGTSCIPAPGYFQSKLSQAGKCPQGCYSCTSDLQCTSCFQRFTLEELSCQEVSNRAGVITALFFIGLLLGMIGLFFGIKLYRKCKKDEQRPHQELETDKGQSGREDISDKKEVESVNEKQMVNICEQPIEVEENPEHLVQTNDHLESKGEEEI